MMGLRALSRRLSPILAKWGESRLSSCLKKINSTAETKCKPGKRDERNGLSDSIYPRFQPVERFLKPRQRMAADQGTYPAFPDNLAPTRTATDAPDADGGGADGSGLPKQ